MAMPGRKLKAPHRHTPTSTHDDTHPTQVIETRWVRPIGLKATCNKPATTVPLSPGYFLTDPTSPKQQAAWRRNATTKQSYTIYAARGERNNSHMPQHNQVQDFSKGGRVGASPWSPCSKRVDLPINTQILGVQSEHPDLIKLSRLILLDDLITNVHK